MTTPKSPGKGELYYNAPTTCFRNSKLELEFLPLSIDDVVEYALSQLVNLTGAGRLEVKADVDGIEYDLGTYEAVPAEVEQPVREGPFKNLEGLVVSDDYTPDGAA